MTLDLNQLANVGEFVGGIAVLITLVYLALQVRQTAIAQKRTSELAAAHAIDLSVDRWSVFRRMLTDRDTRPVWAKALRGEVLTDEDVICLRSVVQQLAYSQVGTLATWRAAGNEALMEALAEAVAVELRGSETLHKAWELVAQEIAVFGDSGIDEFVSNVSSRLGVDPQTAPSSSHWLRSFSSDGAD